MQVILGSFSIFIELFIGEDGGLGATCGDDETETVTDSGISAGRGFCTCRR